MLGYTVKYSLSPLEIPGLKLYFTVYPTPRHNTDTDTDTVQHDEQTVSLYWRCQS